VGTRVAAEPDRQGRWALGSLPARVPVDSAASVAVRGLGSARPAPQPAGTPPSQVRLERALYPRG